MKVILLMGLCLTALTGCGGVALYPVSGTVTLDDKPQEGLLVAFAPEAEGGITATATTDANGKYELTCIKGKGVPSGSYRVSITRVTVVDNASSEEEEAYQSSDSAAYEAMASGGPASDYAKAERKKKADIPAKYNAKTTLLETVAETENTIDFALSSK